MAPDQFSHLLREIDAYWISFSLIELDEGLMRSAASMAVTHGLRDYDAVRCAAGLAVAANPLAVLVSGDVKLLAAWGNSGCATYNIMSTQ